MVRTSETTSPLTRAERRRADRLHAVRVTFMDDPRFHRAGAARRLFDDTDPIQAPCVSWYQPLLDDRRCDDRGPAGRPPKTLVLSAAQERVLFGQFNYARFRMSRLQRDARRRPLCASQTRELLGWHDRAESLRRQIAETNLALVLAMAKRVRAAELDFGDLISEGNMALMRAIDKFDATRGFKFSTYACRAILKAYSRLGMKTMRQRQIAPVEFDPAMERGDAVAELNARDDRGVLSEVKELFEGNAASLTDIERTVIFHRYGLDRPVREAPMTLEQVGAMVGVTKERVRQIQARALNKLRVALESLHPRTPFGDALPN